MEEQVDPAQEAIERYLRGLKYLGKPVIKEELLETKIDKKDIDEYIDKGKKSKVYI